MCAASSNTKRGLMTHNGDSESGIFAQTLLQASAVHPRVLAVSGIALPPIRSLSHRMHAEPQDSYRHTCDSAIRHPSPVVLREDEQRHPVSDEEPKQPNCRLESQESHCQSVLAHRPKPD